MENTHTYFVGRNNILVHNACAPDPANNTKAGVTTESPSSNGRTGRQEKLRDLANDPKASSADRGWINQEMNSIERGNRNSIRNPPGKDLAHQRGREAAKGYDYEYSDLKNRADHKLQHKYDANGTKNKERH